ncbi:MAG TPA: nuclear transport factor 2 family protein [Flavobacterium sp.]|nr:nuclear transport factor 2 family protein [Flavobacterium sp.]
MKKILLFFLALSSFSVAAQTDKVAIDNVLTQWHKAAAEAKFDTYFGLMSKDAVFIGTDPTENWQLDAFKAFSKPFFDKGKAWDFKAVQRNIYVSGDFAWFDELLDTWMKICRGSGVLRKENGQWKVVHYVLSMTVPNDDTKEVIQVKSAFDDALLLKLSGKVPK